MENWFGLVPRNEKSRKSDEKNRKYRNSWRSRFDWLPISLERLEDRVLLAADLAIDKSVAPTGTVVPGELLTYTIHAQNLAAGTTAATGVVVTDTLPAGETFVDAAVTGAGSPTVSGSGSTVTANLGTLSPGSTDTITIQALVDTTATGTLTNSASMTNTSGDTDPAAATASSTVDTTPPTNNVSVSKDSVPTTATGTVGAPLTYHVTITNNNTTAVAGVQLVDVLDPNETFVSATDTNGDVFTNVGGTITGTVSSVAGSGTDVVTVVAIPTTAAGTAGTVTNTATIGVPGGNLSTAVIATKTNAVTPASATGANISVAKDSVPSTATGTVGAPLTYHVTITNNTTTAASGVVLVDQLDPNETFVSASDTNGDTFTNVGGAITGTVTSLAGSGTDTVTIVAIPTAPAGTAGSVTNTATIAVPGGNLSTNIVATKTNTVSPASASGANVSVTKDSVPSTATGTVGAPLTYHVTITNNTATAASGVVLVDQLDPNETFVSASDTNGDTFTNVGGTITGTVTSLAGSAADVVTIVAIPTTAAGVAGSVTNTATIAVPGGNLSTTITAAKTNSVSPASATGANVSVTKDSVPSTVVGNVGSPLTYHVTITNNTTTAAANVQLVDVLDPNETFVSATDTNGDTFTNAGGTITGTVTSLAGSGTDTVTIVATPTAAAATAGHVTNTATIAVPGGNLSTNVTATKTNTVTATPTQADVSITKTGPTTGTVGTNLTYTITVANAAGAASAAGVTMTDTLPAGVTFVSATDSSGGTITNSGGTVTDTIGTLPAGAVDSITIVATPGASTAGTSVTNSASVATTTPNIGTPTTATASTSISSAASQASVSIAKAGPSSGSVGTNLTYTITVANAAGAASAAGVTMTDTLPAGVTFVSATDSSGGTITTSGSTVTDTIGTLAAGATDTITIVATPGASTAGTTITNSASVTTTTSNAGTPTTATASTSISSTTSGPTLTINKSASATGTVGQNLTYNIAIGNTGTGSATGTTFLDTLPAGLTFVSATDSMGGTVTNTGGTLSENIGTLAAGATDTITVVVTPGSSLAGQSVTNTASASATNFNGGVSVTSSATTSISGTTPPITTGVGFLQGVPGDGTPQTFVQNLYRELLGREPDSAGDSFWVAYIAQHNNSAGHAQAIQGFLNSQEYAAHYITTVYEVILGRAPDAPGLQYWTQKMGQPGTPGQNTGSADEKGIVAAFFGSDEFYIKSGNTPQSWINALYEDILNRAPDGSGSAFWANELQTRGSGDRDGIVRDLLTTPEAAHFILDTFYPTAGGTANTPLATPGTTAGTGRNDLSLLTGAGWENLYLEGPFGNNQQGNDAFFAALASGAGWDDVQLLILGTDQFYTNPNRPISA